MKWPRKRIIRGTVALVTALLIFSVCRIAVMGRVRATYRFVEGGQEYTVEVRERSNEFAALDWLFTVAGIVGVEHAGQYSYRAELYQGWTRIASTRWSGAESYYESRISVHTANRTHVQLSYDGGQYSNEERWEPL